MHQEHLRSTKRLGRYHLSADHNTETFPSYFQQLMSHYKDNLDSNKSLRFRHKHDSLERVLARTNRKIQKSINFINKIKSRDLVCVIRAKTIPGNVTIIKEYIKCKKANCSHDRHGPYYYAYWKDPESKEVEEKIHW
jgi:hypothetical protein